MLIYSCISAFLHVEHVGQDIVATEVEEAEVEGPEQQPQEFEVADQVEEQALDSNSANPDLQQGKHRFMLNPVSFKFESYLYYFTCAFKLLGFD